MGPTSASTIASTAKQKQMRGWAVERFGDPSRDDSLISLEELPMPECDRHDVLIRMHGAEIGDWDAIVARGEWSVERPFPIVLGLAGAGIVAAVGEDVAGLEKGAAVYTYSHPLAHRGCRARHHNGAWADYMLVPFDRVALAPTSLDLTHAGAVPIIGLTAHEALVDVLKVTKNDVVLVTAAAGGVGHLAVQIAAGLGARVVATARTQNPEFLRALGAEVVIDYTREDFVEATRKLFPEGVDKALNGVDGETADQVVKAVRPDGHVLDLTGSATASLPDGRVDTDYVVRPDRARLTTLAGMFDRGELRLDVAHTIPFAQAKAALAEVMEKHVRGVVALKIR
jgi:NADPH:quinone reductase-like Zn-dependent oxidoreductase